LKELDGKRYASYDGRFESQIIRQLIKNAGGEGIIDEVLPPKLDCFDCVVRHEAEATWIFQAWEGIAAEMKGIELTYFPIDESEDQNFKYGYSPVLLCNPSNFADTDKRIKLSQFLTITGRGYQYATENPEAAVDALIEASNHHPAVTNCPRDFLIASQRFLSDNNYYLTDHDGKKVWGLMDENRWETFVNWLLSNQLLTHRDGTLVAR
jgi:ABC-type nitrate/sulfonate/bicarbonate transport system substrate-binding protein